MSSQQKLRVLFLTRYPVDGASSRYRVHQYIPHLEQMGVSCTVQSFMDPQMYRLSFTVGGVPRKLWATGKAVLRRVAAVARHREYDVVYMQRELLPFGPPWLERWMQRRGTKLCFDYDDALFIKKPSRFNPLATLFRAPGKVLELFGLVDRVVAGNDWLRDQAAQHGADAVTLEVAEDVSRMPAPGSRVGGGPMTIGWLGSTSTVKYLHLIAPALREIAGRYPDVRFELMGGGDFHMDGVDWHHQPWSLEGEVEALGRFDIGLMPLPMEEWARGKSGGKARTYMAAGVVPVCAAIGYNLELIEHGRTGFLCSSHEEWVAALELLIRESTLRKQVAVAARAEVEQRFDPRGQAEKLRDVLVSLAGG